MHSERNHLYLTAVTLTCEVFVLSIYMFLSFCYIVNHRQLLSSAALRVMKAFTYYNVAFNIKTKLKAK